MLRIFGVSLQNCKLFRLFVGFAYPLGLRAFLCAAGFSHLEAVQSSSLRPRDNANSRRRNQLNPIA
jgi:hypothetical protein